MPETEWDLDETYQPLRGSERGLAQHVNEIDSPESTLHPWADRVETFTEVFGAGLRLENPVYAAGQLLSRPHFMYDPDFDWEAAAQNSAAYERNAEPFIYAASQDEWDFIEQKQAKEQQDQQSLFSHGLGLGMLSGVGAGVLSPTSLMPLMGQAKGIKGVMQSFALAATASGLDELTLQAAQDLRTWEESGINIAFGTVLGGLMGSAAKGLSARAASRVEKDIQVVFREEGEPTYVVVNTPRFLDNDGSVGAARVKQWDVGTFKRGDGALRTAFRTNPHGRLVTDQAKVFNETTGAIETVDIVEGRQFATQMTPNGLKYEGNVKGMATTEDGSVESRIPQHNKPLVDALRIHQAAYARHVSGAGEDHNAVMRTVHNIRGGTKRYTPQGKMTSKEFGDEVSRALNTGDQHAVPEVQETVNAYRDMARYIEAKNEEYYQEAIAALGPDGARRLFRPLEPVVNEKTGEAATYWHHLYDQTKIQGSDFDDYLQGQIAKGLRHYLVNEQKKWTQAVEKFEEDLIKKGVRGTKAYKVHLKELMTERKELVKARDAAKNADDSSEVLKEVTQRHVDEIDETIEKTKVLAKESKIGDVQGRLVDELYETLEEISNAKIERKGATSADIKAGTADFDALAGDLARHLAHKIRNNDLRVSGADIVQGKRGPELLRMINDDYDSKARWLVTDPDIVSRAYMRQMAADLEMHRAFGSVNASKQLDAVGAAYDKLIRQVTESGVDSDQGKASAALRKLREGADVKRVDETFENATISGLQAQRARALRDMRVLIERTRHQRSIPDNAAGLGYRTGRLALNFNVPIMMGMVLTSSIADPARTIAKFHAGTILKDGVWRGITDRKMYNMAKDQLYLSGVLHDMHMHSRTQIFTEMFDGIQHKGTKLERGVEWLANKTGIFALFEQWTLMNKGFAGNVMLGELSRGIRAGIDPSKFNKAEQKMYKEMLASISLTPEMQGRIWKQMTETPAGGTQYGDNWLPNMESWGDLEAVNALKAAITQMTEFDTIITPGIAKPTWTDENIAWRQVAQFRSFSDASFNKTFLPMLQDAELDMNGARMAMYVLSSLGLGIMSYMSASAFAGGDQWERAKNASVGTLIDEGFDRSGLLGWLATGMQVADQIPATSGALRLGDQRVSRRSAQGSYGMALGPTYGTAGKLIELVKEMDDPTASTVHKMRQLTPWNQVVWLRRIMTEIEEAAVNASGVPESRR